MNTFLRIFTLSAIIALVLSACTLFNNTPTVTGDPALQASPQPTPTPALTMTVTHARVDQTINYNYLIGNTSGTPVPGPVTVTDDKVQITCPEITNVGNLDNNLDTNEALSCTGIYTITQADLDAGSVTTFSTASASGYVSSGVTTTVPIEQTRSLTLSKAPDPQSFNSVGETIIYSYTITNTGTTSLGPVQFTITDDKIVAAFNCGSDGTILAPGGTVSCSASYVTTETDLAAGLVTNSAFASDGTTNSNPVTTTVNRGTTPPPNLTPGSDISHTVVAGEWLWQIARCYGADPKQVMLDNPMVDHTKLKPNTIVTVRNIGSTGTIYGEPCVHIHRVVSGDTWESIAGKYSNVNVSLLTEANPGGLVPGEDVKVPVGPYLYP